MANLLKYDATYGTLLSAFVTGDLDAKTNGTYVLGGTGAAAVIDNSTTLDMYLDVRVKLGSINPAAGDYVSLSLLTSMDGGTAYEDPTSGIAPPADVPTYLLYLTTGASAKMRIKRGIILPPGKSKLLFGNKTVTLATGGNAVDYWIYTNNLNG
jgi:hypothetical protein